MKFSVQYLSFFVIQVEGKEGQLNKSYKHYQTLDDYEYEDSDIKRFLDGEYSWISKRKVEKNPNTEQAPNKNWTFYRRAWIRVR